MLSSLPDLSLQIPSGIKDRYRHLALVSKQRHIDRLDLNDDETLIVCYDWLLWRTCVDKGLACLFFETGLLDWGDLENPKKDLPLLANEWLFMDGKDATFFKSVSIGKQFIGEMKIVYFTLYRLSYSARWFVEKFRPQTITVFDCRIEEFEPSPELKTLIIKQAADEFGAQVKTSFEENSVSETAYGSQVIGQDTDAAMNLLRWGYALMADVLFRIKDVFSLRRKKRILALPTGAMSRGLIKSSGRNDVQLILLAEFTPKRIGFLWQCFRHGISLRHFGRRKLSSADIRSLDEIVERLSAHLAREADGISLLLNRYVMSKILPSGRFHNVAGEVNRIIDLFRRVKPDHLLVSSVRNQRKFCDVAGRLNIPVDFMMHGLYLSDFTYEGLCGDHNEGAVVSRLLAWGEHNQTWLKQIGSKVPSIRIGHPGYHTFHRPEKMNLDKNARIVILPTTCLISDYTVLFGDCIEYLVQTVKMLEHMGYTNITIKFHPGTHTLHKYREILDYHGARAKLTRSGDLSDYVAWSDVVIGSPWTSGFLDVLTKGKPYIPVLLKRSVADPKLLEPFKLVRTQGDLYDALENGLDQDWNLIMEQFLSYPEITNPSQALWTAVCDEQLSPNQTQSTGAT